VRGKPALLVACLTLAVLVPGLLVACAPSSTQSAVPTVPAAAARSALPSAVPLPSPAQMQKLTATGYGWIRRDSQTATPKDWHAGAPLALYGRAAEGSAVTTAYPVFAPKPKYFLVPVDGSKGPVGDFWISVQPSGGYSVVASGDGAHQDYDDFARGLHDVTSALGSGSRAVAFKGTWDGVYGENGSQVAVVFVGQLPGVGPAWLSTRFERFHVYRGSDASKLAALAMGQGQSTDSTVATPAQ
jgi:hypothetical protein